LKVQYNTRLQNDLYCVGWGVKLYSIQFNTIRYGKRVTMRLKLVHVVRKIRNHEKGD